MGWAVLSLREPPVLALHLRTSYLLALSPRSERHPRRRHPLRRGSEVATVRPRPALNKGRAGPALLEDEEAAVQPPAEGLR